jgi:hypothetical protein
MGGARGAPHFLHPVIDVALPRALAMHAPLGVAHPLPDDRRARCAA